jgi:hypothetical protein
MATPAAGAGAGSAAAAAVPPPPSSPPAALPQPGASGGASGGRQGGGGAVRRAPWPRPRHAGPLQVSSGCQPPRARRARYLPVCSGVPVTEIPLRFYSVHRHFLCR